MDTVRVNLLSPESNVVAPPKAGPTAAQRRQGVVVAAVLAVMLAVSGARWLGERKAAAPARPQASPSAPAATTTFLVDPVCNGLVDPGKAKYAVKIAGSTMLFEHAECAQAFREDPIRYAHVTKRVRVSPTAVPVATAPTAPAAPPSDLALPDDSAATAPPPQAVIPDAPAAAPVTEAAPPPQGVPGYPQGFSQVPTTELPQPAPAVAAPAPPGTKVPTLPQQTIDAKPTPDADAPSVEESVPGGPSNVR